MTKIKMRQSLYPLLLGFSLMLIAGAPTTVYAGILAGFELNESGDLSGGSHTLYPHGSTWDSTDKAPGGYSTESMSCRGAEDRFSTVIGTIPDGGSQMTWMCWIKPDSTYRDDTKIQNVFGAATDGLVDGGAGEFQLWMWDGAGSAEMFFKVGDGTGEKYVRSTASHTVSEDVWTHVAVVFDAGTLTMYINGEYANSVTIASTIPALTGRELSIGTSPNALDWAGGIDEFVWLDEALDANAIQQIIDRGIFEYSLGPELPAGKMSYIIGYELNESGDFGSGGHTLYNHGSTWDNADHAPGTYSTQSMACRGPEDRFSAVVSALPDGGNQMSWVCWIKPNSAYRDDTKIQMVFGAAADGVVDGGPGEFQLWMWDGVGSAEMFFKVGDGTGEKYVRSFAKISEDVWSHIAIVFDAGTLTMYINGRQANKITIASAIPALTGRELTIGTSPNALDWAGWIDEVAWFKGTLNRPQIRDIMDNGLAAFETFPSQCGDSGTQYLTGDLNEDCYVNMGDVDVIAEQWLRAGDFSSGPAANPVIYAPQIAAITVDGNPGDWSTASEWANFGTWFGGGLASTTRAKYAWNIVAKRVYAIIESDEGTNLNLELGGLMGTISQSATPEQGIQATQLTFSNWSGGVPTTMVNNGGGTTTGISAAYTLNGSILTIELSLPIYSNWHDANTVMTLADGMDIYEYANIQDQWWTAGDSQIANGTYVWLFGAPIVNTSSIIRLVDSLPAQCGDLPNRYVNKGDVVQDCIVNFSDFATFALRWLECSDPANTACDQYWQ